jgi:hypothetical protein
MVGSSAGLALNATEPRPVGRGLGSIALHGGLAAVMYYTAMSLFVPAAFIHAGLRNGRRGVWGAIGAASLLLLIVAPAISPTTALPAAMASVSRFIFEIALPTGIITLLVARTVSFGNVLITALGGSFLGFFVTEALLRAFMNYSPYQTIVGNFRAITAGATELNRKLGSPPESLQAFEKISEVVASSFMPSVLVSATAIMFVLSLIMIPRLPAGRATGSTYFFRRLALPEHLLFAFVAGGLSPLASGALRIAGLNILAIVGFLYLLQGLAVVRALLLQLGFGLFATLLTFAVLAMFSGYGIAPVALAVVGLFDSFFDFRKLNRKEASNESNSD